jgi:hypothetical protein
MAIAPGGKAGVKKSAAGAAETSFSFEPKPNVAAV